MDKKVFQEAFSQIHASEETVTEVLNMPGERKKVNRGSGRIVRRLTACAAAVAVLIGLSMLPGVPTEVPDGTGGTQVIRRPMLGIQVYAAEGVVELGEETVEPIFAGEENTDETDIFGLPNDGQLRVFNSITGEWELVFKNEEEEKLPCFELIVWYHDLLADQYRPMINVYQDGEKVDLYDKNSKNYLLSWSLWRDGKKGWSLKCSFEEQTTLEIVVTDKEDGTLLISQTIRVTPAVYETAGNTANAGGSTGENAWLKKSEGYMLEVIEEYKIEQN